MAAAAPQSIRGQQLMQRALTGSSPRGRRVVSLAQVSLTMRMSEKFTAEIERNSAFEVASTVGCQDYAGSQRHRCSIVSCETAKREAW
jgi:hypothetical protein